MHADYDNIKKIQNELIGAGAHTRIGVVDCIGNSITCSRGISKTDILLPSFTIICESGVIVACTLYYEQWIAPNLYSIIGFSKDFLGCGAAVVRPPEEIIYKYVLTYLHEGEFSNIFHSQIMGHLMIQLWAWYRHKIDAIGREVVISDLDDSWTYKNGRRNRSRVGN